MRREAEHRPCVARQRCHAPARSPGEGPEERLQGRPGGALVLRHVREVHHATLVAHQAQVLDQRHLGMLVSSRSSGVLGNTLGEHYYNLGRALS